MKIMSRETPINMNLKQHELMLRKDKCNLLILDLYKHILCWNVKSKIK